MRQQYWLELLKDYGYEISYHLGKANRVVDALSKKSSIIIVMLCEKPELMTQIQEIQNGL